jgi:hypothetical protein
MTFAHLGIDSNKIQLVLFVSDFQYNRIVKKTIV